MPVGFLFTDIQDSTERWERAPERMRRAVDRQNAIIDALVAKCGGVIHDRAGDGVFAVFTAGDPLQCALDIQLAMQREDWSSVGGLEFRLGVHVGADGASLDQASVNRAARIMGSGWGGQIVVSGEAIAAYRAPKDATFVDLGVCQFKGIDEPLRLSGLVHPLLEKKEFPPLRSHLVQGLNIPKPSGPLFGRARETAEIVTKLSEVRLLTIVGPGGNGKTRLAIEVASQYARTDPVAFVSLEAVRGRTELISAVAAALRYPLHGSDPHEQQLVCYLRERSLLLVLDNADAIAGHADFVQTLSATCPRVTILATSREPLHLAAEVLYRLGGLLSDEADSDGVGSPAFQLFEFEAKTQGADIALAGEAQHFSEICELVGGSPLALRLVARWSRLLSPSEVIARLRGGGNLLTDPGDAQPGLAGVFEGSWRLLDTSQQAGLARLSVFAGTFDWSAAEHVAEIELATYRALADKSLLDEGAPRRFKIHPLVRAYARQKLALTPAVEARALRRHAEHYLDLVRVKVTDCAPNAQRAVFDQLQADFPNIRSAWVHGIAIDLENVRRAVLPLHEFLTKRSMINEGVGLFAIESGDRTTRSLIQGTLAHCVFNLGEFDRSETLARRIFAERGGTAPRALARDIMGGLAHVRGDYAAARRHYERAIALWARLGNAMRGSYSSSALALLHFAHARLGEASACNRQAFRLSRQAGNTLGMLLAQQMTGDLALKANRLGAARINYEKALSLDVACEAPHYRAAVLRRLGTLHRQMHNLVEALQCHREALHLTVETGEQRSQSHALVDIGEDLLAIGDADAARGSLIEGVRLAVRLDARAPETQGLIALAKLEFMAGSQRHAQAIASVLASRSVGDQYVALQALFDALGGVPTVATHARAINDILDDIADDADLGTLE